MPRSGPVAVNRISDIVLNPALWRFLLFAGQPVRLAIAANVFVGRSLRSLGYELLRRLNDLVGWLYGRVQLRRLRGFDRRYFTLRRWHLTLAALAGVRTLHVLLRRWADQTSGRAARKRELHNRMASAREYK